MSRSEKSILNDTLVAVSALPDTIAWRNNTGQAWQGRKVNAAPGETVKVQPGMVILAEARPITFGLPGSGDILGCSGGLPLSIETKTETGRASQIQINFAARWTQCGGVSILTRSPEQAVFEISRRKDVDSYNLIG